ncbi:14064_t:CDS:2, partial [Entrophospora sp. SA101]
GGSKESSWMWNLMEETEIRKRCLYYTLIGNTMTSKRTKLKSAFI